MANDEKKEVTKSDIDEAIARAKASHEAKPPIVTKPVLTVEEARNHIKKIDDFLFKKDENGKSVYAGVVGFNPYLYRQQVLNEFENSLSLIEDKFIIDTTEINKILASIMAIKPNVVPDGKALRRDSLIARERPRTNK